MMEIRVHERFFSVYRYIKGERKCKIKHTISTKTTCSGHVSNMTDSNNSFFRIFK